MNKKQIGRTAVFLLLLLAVVLYLNHTLKLKWLSPCYESVTFPEFEELDENSVEVCVLGSSQIIYGVSGMQLYGEYGISAYSRGSAVQPMAVSYALLKESMKTQDIKLAVLDVSSLYETPGTSQWRKALDSMKFSEEKMEALQVYSRVVEDADPLVSFFFPLIKYHTRWDELKKRDFEINAEEQAVYRGYYMERRATPEELTELTYDNDEYEDDLQMVEYQKAYLDKITEYCEAEGVELLLIKTPKEDWSITEHTQVQEYAEEKGLPFFDFSSLAMFEELGLDANTDFYDEEHLNLRGAQKLTAWLGNYISEHYELTDFRQTEGFDDLGYEAYAQDALLYTTTDIEEYLAALDSERYEVLIQYMDDAPQLYCEEIASGIKSLGLSVDLTEAVGQKYAAWVSEGECKYEAVSEKKNLNYPDQFKDGTAFRIFSNFDESKVLKIRLDYEDVALTTRGLHILVYDCEKQQRVDTSTIYYDEETDSLQMIKEVWQ